MLRHDQDLAQRLVDMLDRLDRAVEAAVAPADPGPRLSRELWRVLLLLNDGRGHAMGEVAERAGVPGPTATRLIDRLVADNWVYRRPDPLDRRKVVVHLAETGQMRLEEVMSKVRGTVVNVIAQLEEDDRRQLREVLHRLTGAMQET
ncbi:MAG: MarR family winged helix-turn-helix transcriptional regulator [Egibacteraceae bacterium]